MLFGCPLWPFAADAGSGSIDLAVFAEYGVLGVIAMILIWFARGAHQRERERADRMEEENRRLNALILDRVIPALTSATNAVEESAELLNAIQREREFQALADRRQPPPHKRGGSA